MLLYQIVDFGIKTAHFYGYLTQLLIYADGEHLAQHTILGAYFPRGIDAN